MKIKKHTIRKRSRCRISVSRKTAGPSVSVIQKTRSTSGRGSHTCTPQTQRKGATTALSLNTHTVSPPPCMRAPTQVCPVHLRAVSVGLRGAGECWREPSGAEAWQVGIGQSWSVASLLPFSRSSKLVHDAVCVVD